MNLAVSNKPQFISEIFTDASGRSFKLTFLVISVNGELKGRLVSAEPIAKQNGQTFYLPVFSNADKKETIYRPAFVPVISPYQELFFITSQPTRAPSHN